MDFPRNFSQVYHLLFNFGNSLFPDSAQYSACLFIRDQYLSTGGLQLVNPKNVHNLRYIYRAFIVLKPGPVKRIYRLVVDGRPGNPYHVK